MQTWEETAKDQMKYHVDKEAERVMKFEEVNQTEW